MSYLKILNFTREPFSNSPDPQSYYPTGMHEQCLHRLEIALHLKRGLNVVLGEVGTGKSTLMRTLLQSLSEQEDVLTYVILDPNFPDEITFVKHLHSLLGLPPWAGTSADTRRYIEEIQAATFNLAVNQGRTLVLLVDEAQKLQPFCLEVLRTLLNFETNTEKLIQIVLFGQLEMMNNLAAMPNFKDRVNEFIHLKPLSFSETAGLIRYRLRRVGGPKAEQLFTWPALYAIYRISYGRPRRIMNLCHRFLLSLIIQNRSRITWGAVWAEKKRMDILGEASPLTSPEPPKRHSKTLWLVVCIVFLGILFVLAPKIPFLNSIDTHSWMRTESSAPQPGIAQPSPTQPSISQPVAQAQDIVPAEAGKVTLQRLDTAQNPPQIPGAPSQTSAAPVVQPAVKPAAPPTASAPVAPPQALSVMPSTTATVPPMKEPEPFTPQPSLVTQDTLVYNPLSSAQPLLGVYSIQAGESLAKIIQAFYGIIKPTMPELLKANPHIRDINKVTVNTNIVMPAIPQPMPERYTQQFFLTCGNYDSPQDAYAAFRKLRRHSQDFLIVPYAFSGNIAFKIIDPRLFADTFTAEKVRGAMKGDINCYVDRFNKTDILFRTMPEE